MLQRCYAWVGVGAEEKLLFESTSITINDNEWKGLKFAAFANMQSFIISTKYEPFYSVEKMISLFQDLNKKSIPHLQFNNTLCNMYIYINIQKHRICPFIQIYCVMHIKYLEKEPMIFKLYPKKCRINDKVRNHQLTFEHGKLIPWAKQLDMLLQPSPKHEEIELLNDEWVLKRKEWVDFLSDEVKKMHNSDTLELCKEWIFDPETKPNQTETKQTKLDQTKPSRAEPNQTND